MVGFKLVGGLARSLPVSSVQSDWLKIKARLQFGLLQTRSEPIPIATKITIHVETVVYTIALTAPNCWNYTRIPKCVRVYDLGELAIQRTSTAGEVGARRSDLDRTRTDRSSASPN
jgi:hypothetical protein